MATHNRQWLLQERPLGMVEPENFKLVETDLPQPDLKSGQVLVKTLMLGFDPAMRGWLADEPSYLPPVAIGEPMRASGVGQVVQSENSELPVGTLVQGLLNWQEYGIGDPAGLIPPTALPAGTPPNLALSVFGSTSLTAYFGLLDVGQPSGGRNGTGLGRGGCDRLCRGADSPAKRLPGGGYCRWREKCAWLLERLQTGCCH